MPAAAATPTPLIGLFTLDAAAAQLGVAPVAVQRLIARDVLKRVRPDDDHRFTEAELRSYVSRGLPDLDSPAIGGDGWLVDDTGKQADVLVDQLSTALARSVPSDEALAARVEAHYRSNGALRVGDPSVPSLTLPLTLSPEATELLSRPASKGRSQFTPPGVTPPPSRYSTMRELFTVDRLRTAAERVVKKLPDIRTTPAERLYRDYDGVLAQAQELMLARQAVVISKLVTGLGGMGGAVPVTFALPMSAVASPVTIAAAKQVGF